MEIRALGDSAVVIVYESTHDRRLMEVVRQDYSRLTVLGINGVIDIVPCFSSIGVYFNPEKISYNKLRQELESVLKAGPVEGQTSPIEQPAAIRIPVSYGGRHGPDLERLASMLDMSPDQLIRAHTTTTYTVYGIGFLPGFPYMGPLPDKLVIPRKSVPTAKVPAGSVAIAGTQTGVYPFASPGGWHVIGWTPVKMFDPERHEPCLLKTGDKVRFTCM